MRAVNLREFWSVQKCSGGKTHIFLSYDKAQAACDKWNADLNQQLERWEAGDRSISDSLISSQLEPDLEGGCYQSYTVNDAWRPSGIYHHPAYSVEEENWNDAVGFNSIDWGSPATARPVKASR